MVEFVRSISVIAFTVSKNLTNLHLVRPPFKPHHHLCTHKSIHTTHLPRHNRHLTLQQPNLPPSRAPLRGTVSTVRTLARPVEAAEDAWVEAARLDAGGGDARNGGGVIMQML
jgi:hypothetical protein